MCSKVNVSLSPLCFHLCYFSEFTKIIHDTYSYTMVYRRIPSGDWTLANCWECTLSWHLPYNYNLLPWVLFYASVCSWWSSSPFLKKPASSFYIYIFLIFFIFQSCCLLKPSWELYLDHTLGGGGTYNVASDTGFCLGCLPCYVTHFLKTDVED